jgi:MoaA/NifB/PqqE/SkfB family radical SAM enzyme
MGKLFAAFILSAENGCNENCRGCAVAQRREARVNRLTHEQFVWFLHDTLRHLCVGQVAVQGFEPLLEDTFPLTHDMLALGTAYACPTTMVTNGLNLPRYVGELADILNGLTVSLESAKSEIHDWHRGVPGALERTKEGIRAALPYFGRSLAVNAVFFPRCEEYFEGMVDMLASIGVRTLIVTPFIDFKRGVHVPTSRSVQELILRLAEDGRRARPRVRVLLSDEMRKLPLDHDFLREVELNSMRKTDGLFRLSPDGHCAIAGEAFRAVEGTALWDGVEQPHLFLERIFWERKGARLRRKSLIKRALVTLADKAFEALRV